MGSIGSVSREEDTESNADGKNSSSNGSKSNNNGNNSDCKEVIFLWDTGKGSMSANLMSLSTFKDVISRSCLASSTTTTARIGDDGFPRNAPLKSYKTYKKALSFCIVFQSRKVRDSKDYEIHLTFDRGPFSNLADPLEDASCPKQAVVIKKIFTIAKGSALNHDLTVEIALNSRRFDGHPPPCSYGHNIVKTYSRLPPARSKTVSATKIGMPPPQSGSVLSGYSTVADNASTETTSTVTTTTATTTTTTAPESRDSPLPGNGFLESIAGSVMDAMTVFEGVDTPAITPSQTTQKPMLLRPVRKDSEVVETTKISIEFPAKYSLDYRSDREVLYLHPSYDCMQYLANFDMTQLNPLPSYKIAEDEAPVQETHVVRHDSTNKGGDQTASNDNSNTTTTTTTTTKTTTTTTASWEHHDYNSPMCRMACSIIECGGKKLSFYDEERDRGNINNDGGQQEVSPQSSSATLHSLGNFTREDIKIIELHGPSPQPPLSPSPPVTTTTTTTTTRSSPKPSSAENNNNSAAAAVPKTGKKYIVKISSKLCQYIRSIFKKYDNDIYYTDVVTDNIRYTLRTSDKFTIPDNSTRVLTFCLDVEYMLVPFVHDSGSERN